MGPASANALDDKLMGSLISFWAIVPVRNMLNRRVAADVFVFFIAYFRIRYK